MDLNTGLLQKTGPVGKLQKAKSLSAELSSVGNDNYYK